MFKLLCLITNPLVLLSSRVWVELYSKNPDDIKNHQGKKILLILYLYLLPSRLYCRSWDFTKSAIHMARGLYRRSGITPCPEDTIYFICI
ncbi:hypothetical protein CLG_B0336 [Clostridium botulinum D str. 1873]|uniref:Uncharacterized protein n=1 Tax=Clostridium botulinum D str. 1873 TaxID=592027 RepID=A0A9P2G9E1_CLOBO|nr:hypothetical protein CLG_B0336 [Clostridium botulinum D str. 1873]